MNILFARHGESEANLLHVISNRDVHHRLTDVGIGQAQTLADRAWTLGVTRIYASPILRARTTAEIVAGRLHLPVEISDALREFDCGLMEGRGDDEAWEAHSAVCRAWFEEGNLDAKIAEGESFQEICGRFSTFLDRLIRQHGDGKETILLVSHGATLRCVLSTFVENLNDAIILERGFAYTSVIECEVQEDRLWCTRWNGNELERIDAPHK